MLATLAQRLKQLTASGGGGAGRRWAEALQLWQQLRSVEKQQRLTWACSSLITCCGNAKQWQISLQLLQDAKENSASDDGCCSAAISACAKGMHWEKALSTFASSPPSTVSYNATISACSRCTQWPIALRLFEDAVAAEKVDHFTFNATISSCGKGQHWLHALRVFSDMKQPDKVSYGALVVACEKASSWPFCLQLFQLMRPQHRDQLTLATLISACERGRRWQEALHFLQLMRRSTSMQPSAVVHGVAIGACVKSQQLEAGLSLYDSMLAEKLVPHEITSSSLVVALATAHRWSEALSLASQSELTPAALIASTTAAEILSQWQDALVLLERFQPGKGSSLPLLALTAAASCAPAVRGGQLLREVDLQLQSSSVLVEHNAAITAAERSSHWALALHWFWQLSRSGARAPGLCGPDAFSMAAALRACEHPGQWQMAVELLQCQKVLRISPDVVVYSSAITACEKNQQWHMALKVFEQMKDAGILPNAVTYAACISACGRSSDWAKAVDFLMSARNAQQLSTIACNATIAACANGHEWQVPLQLLQMAPEKTLLTFSSAISACERSAQWQHALWILQEMQLVVFADNSAMNLCISACVKAEQSQMATQLLRKGLVSAVRENG